MARSSGRAAVFASLGALGYLLAQFTAFAVPARPSSASSRVPRSHVILAATKEDVSRKLQAFKLQQWAASQLEREGSPLAQAALARAKMAEDVYLAVKAQSEGRAPAPAPAAAPAAAPGSSAPLAPFQHDLAEAKKRVELLKWAADKLASKGGDVDGAMKARTEQAVAEYRALLEGGQAGGAGASAPASAPAAQQAGSGAASAPEAPASAPSRAVTKADVKAAKKKLELLAWAFNTLADKGSSEAEEMKAKMNQAVANFGAISEAFATGAPMPAAVPLAAASTPTAAAPAASAPKAVTTPPTEVSAPPKAVSAAPPEVSAAPPEVSTPPPKVSAPPVAKAPAAASAPPTPVAPAPAAKAPAAAKPESSRPPAAAPPVVAAPAPAPVAAPAAAPVAAAAAAAAPAVKSPEQAASTAAQKQLLKTPKETYQALVEAGVKTVKTSTNQTLYASITAGAYIGIAGLLSLVIAGNLGRPSMNTQKLVFAAIFPVSLLLVLQNGGQLFTGNTATTSMAFYEGRVTLPQVLKNWAITAAGNLVGCLGMAMVAYFSDLLVGGTQALSVALAIKKCAYAWGPTMVKAVMCNWLVCMATFLATSASDTVGKVVGIWFPISMFVAIGFEHLEANMFILPASILAGAPFSLGEIFVKNLIPVMLGNAFAGAFIVGAGFAFSQGRLGKGGGGSFGGWVRGLFGRKKKVMESA